MKRPIFQATNVCNHQIPVATRSLMSCLLVLAVSGCASLPASAPTVGQVSRAAKSTASAPAPYRLVAIDANVVQEQAEAQSLGVLQLGALSSNVSPQRADLIRKGDTLTISIFEVGVSLFASGPASPGADASRAPTVGTQTITVQVREDGSVTLPYVGTVIAADTYPEALSATIKQRLRHFSESPDVLVNIVETLENVVYISGTVARSGRFRLTAAHERLLDALALAGGSPIDVNDLQITLVRGTHKVTAPLNQIGAGDLANLRLLPGDRLSLERVRPSYTVFGATDRVNQVPFEARQLNLAEAIARAAGPADWRANPRGVYLFRLEKSGEGKMLPVVYQINMLKPEAYFLAQQFAVRDKDVILFANSSASAVQKGLGLLSQLFSPALAVRTATQ